MSTPDGRLLRQLRLALPGSIPLSELGETVRLPLDEIARRIAALQAVGYEIEIHPHQGYRFVKAPAHLMAEDIAAMLEPQPIGREIIVLRETRSTNDLALKAGEEGAAHGLVFFAEQQTAGRGRHGRQWQSDSGKNLALSVLLRPHSPSADWPRLALAAAYAVALTVEEFCLVEAGIKWPNDLLINGRKICGILLESRIATDRAGFVVVGIGLNVNQETFPPELTQTATSMARLCARPLERNDVATALLRHLQKACDMADEAALLEEVAARSTLVGREILLDTGTGLLTGRVTGFNPQGHLLLQNSEGNTLAISSGEITRVFYKDDSSLSF